MAVPLPASLTSSERDVSSVLGSTVPRLFTPPLVSGPAGPCGCGCALTPETSYGFDVVEFATDLLDRPPRPWQRFAAIHGGELLPDGRPRGRVVLLLASRQNGKTELPVMLSLYWQFVEAVPLILGTSTKLDYARESWKKAVKLAERAAARHPELAALMPRPRWKREANGEQESWTTEDSRYKIAASNEEGGRSLTVHRGILDELRQHHDYSAWAAIEPAASPWDAQLWAMTNAGDDRSIVLNDLRADALDAIEAADTRSRLVLLEWSAPEDADPEDVDALVQANPSVGYGLDLDVLLDGARTAKKLGGEALASFKTERMCVRVQRLNLAIDPHTWAACLDPAPVDVAQRQRLAACVDLSPDGNHATLAVAVCGDGRVRVETVHEWSGPDAASRLERELAGWAQRVRPTTLGWFPAGPAAAVAAKLADRRQHGVRGWPPRGVAVAEIRGETTAVCMGLAKEITAGTLAHSGQLMLDAQIGAAEKLTRGDAWVFARAGEGNVDAVYAVAGAVHLARTAPAPRSMTLPSPSPSVS